MAHKLTEAELWMLKAHASNRELEFTLRRSLAEKGYLKMEIVQDRLTGWTLTEKGIKALEASEE